MCKAHPAMRQPGVLNIPQVFVLAMR